jgi:hypothetical protein
MWRLMQRSDLAELLRELPLRRELRGDFFGAKRCLMELLILRSCNPTMLLCGTPSVHQTAGSH